MAFDLGSVLGTLGSVLPTNNEIANQLVTATAGTVILAGLKSGAGQDAVDPLHLFHQNGTSTVIGKSITAAAFGALDAASKAQVLAAGYVIAG